MALSIDLTTVAIIFVAGLIAIGLTAWMLNRAWGNFPTRAGLPPASPSPAAREDERWAPEDDDQGDGEGDDEGEREGRPLPAGASTINLVEVTHPMVLLAVQRAMEKPGSPYTTYFIREGERVFLVLSRIADPAQREAARRLFEGLSGGDMGNVDLGEAMRVINQLGKR